jgi:hypothetical protein
MPKSIQDLGFRRISAQGQQIVTSSLVSGGGASVVGLTDFREPATAGSASDETGEKVTWPACTLRTYASVLGHDARPRRPLALLDQIPQLVVNNTQVRDALVDPFGFRVYDPLRIYKGPEGEYAVPAVPIAPITADASGSSPSPRPASALTDTVSPCASRRCPPAPSCTQARTPPAPRPPGAVLVE